MNQLLKYVLIVNITLIVLVSGLWLAHEINMSYKENYYSQSELNAINAENELIPAPSSRPGRIDALVSVLAIIVAFGLLIFIVIMSAVYQFKNPTGLGFLKSLLIPLLAWLIELIGLIIFWNTCSGEDCMGGLYIIGYLIVFVLLVLIVNSIILFFRYNRVELNLKNSRIS